MSCITRSSLRLSKGCVSWILMLHIGQYLLVWRYFTIQLLQTADGGEKKELNTSLFFYFTLRKHENRSSLCLRLKLTGVQTLCNCRGVYEVTCAKVADDVFVQVLDLQLDLLLLGHTKLCLIKPLRIHFCSYDSVHEKPLPGLTIGLNRI